MRINGNGLWRAGFVAPVLLVAWLVAGIGCGEDEARVVDFKKTIAAARPSLKPHEPTLRVAVAAMMSPKETFRHYRRLLAYLGRKIGRRVVFVQRKTYGEINRLIGAGAIDVAFVCSGPYVSGKKTYGLRLLAVPVIRGSHYYQSYLIVGNKSGYRSLEDLRRRVFAFTDPESLTGRIVPTFWLAKTGRRPETFFKQIIYTHSHDNSIIAVAKGLVDGAAVDGLIWEYYHRRKPTITSRTRIIKRSRPFGMPPVVVSKYLSPRLSRRILKILLNVHLAPEGQKILGHLMIDRFIEARDDWYDSIRGIGRKSGKKSGVVRVAQKS